MAGSATAASRHWWSLVSSSSASTFCPGTGNSGPYGHSLVWRSSRASAGSGGVETLRRGDDSRQQSRLFTISPPKRHLRTLVSAQQRCMRKTFTFLAFRGARKKLDFVLPLDGRGHNYFRGAQALLRSKRGYSRRLGTVIR